MGKRGLVGLTPLSVLFMEETGVHGENHRAVATTQVTDKLYHIMINDVSSTPCHERDSNSQLKW